MKSPQGIENSEIVVVEEQGFGECFPQAILLGGVPVVFGIVKKC